MSMNAGEVAALLGPNGAGKTTLLHTLLGLLTPQEGTVLVNGRPVHEFSRTERSKLIGLVPQFEGIPFDFTVDEYVLMGRAPHLGMLATPKRADWEVARLSLEELGIHDLHNRSILELSGGERQMVVLARALAQEPRLLLMDEPLAHLDLGNRARILRMIQQSAGKGMTVLFTTHDPDSAASVAKHLVLMRQGRALRSGPLDEVLTDEALSETYGVPVRVARVDGHPVIILKQNLRT
jgi:iron complex transport system ATP-binding protein